jgi:hypothetical protein
MAVASRLVTKATGCRTFAVVSLFFIALLFSHPGDASAQSADKIIKQAIRAMGGEKALRRIRSRQIKGSITRLQDGSTGGYKEFRLSPNLYSFGLDTRGFEVSAGFNGKSAWRRDSRDGLRTLTAQAGADFQAEAAFRNLGLVDYKKLKAKAVYAGQSQIDGKPAHSVMVTTNRNIKVKLYFDLASALPVKEEIGQGETARVFEYSDYRQTGGVMEPFAFTLQEGDQTYLVKVSEVLHNQMVDRAVFDFPIVSDEPLPDFTALLLKVRDNQDTLDRLLENYGYTETISSRQIDKQGRVQEKENETYEISFFKGFRIRRLVAKNGSQLSPSEQGKEDRRIEKIVRDLEAGKEVDDPANNRRVQIADLFKGSKFVNARRERFRNRPVIVADFEPNPAFKPSKMMESFWSKVIGSIWIDSADLQVARVEVTLVKSFNIGGGLFFSMKPGAKFIIEQNRFGDEVWLPTHSEVDFSARALLLAGIGINRTVKYDNYRRFNVDAQETLKPTPEQPTKPER